MLKKVGILIPFIHLGEEFLRTKKGNENSYLYVTTQFIDYAILDKIHNLMSNEEYLIIATTSYDENIINKFKNIMIKKIPEMLLNKCMYDVENYNLIELLYL